MPRMGVNRRGKTAHKKDHEIVLEYLSSRPNEEFLADTVGLYTKIKNPRKALDRFVKSGIIQKIKKGYNSFYVYPTQATGPGASIGNTEIEELEQKLLGLIQLEEPKIPQYHNVRLYIKKEQLDKTIVPPSDAIKIFFNAINPKSPYQCWLWKAESWHDIKGGIQDYRYYKGHRVIFQLFGTGNINIFLEASEHPLELFEVLEYFNWVDGMFTAMCNIGFGEVLDATTITWEWAHDEMLESIEGHGSFAITVKDFRGMMSRLYTKRFADGRVGVRTEQVIDDYTSLPDFLRSSTVQFGGGVNSQYLIRNHFEVQKNITGMLGVIQKLANNIEFNQLSLGKQNTEIQQLHEQIDEISVGLGLKKKKEK